MVIMLCCPCVTKILFLICFLHQFWNLSKACTEQQLYHCLRVCVYVCGCVCNSCEIIDLNENSCFYNKLALLPCNFSQGQNVLPCVEVDGTPGCFRGNLWSLQILVLDV